MLDILSGLNPQQQEAVTYLGSPLLLLAGAGSGKTRVLTHRAAYFISQKLAHPSEVLLLTFTNKAAGEMKQRMSQLISSNSDLSSNNLFAGTFHSFCCRILRREGRALNIPSNFVIYDTQDQEDLIKVILNEMDLSPKEFKPGNMLYFIEAAKNSYQNPEEVSSNSNFWQSYAAKVYKTYQKKLQKFHALDFNDLLFKTVDLFFEYPSILEKYQDIYKYILVDEYQDTNQIQYLLTKLLAQKNRQITAVGDASQAIYGWRGADYRNLNSFTSDFKDTKVINLEQNYRSTQIILDAANAVIVKNTTHPVLKLFTNKKTKNKIKIYSAESEIAEADYVAAKIESISRELRLPLKNIAVLYRMNAQSRVLEEAFLKLSLPYVLIGGLRFYDRAEVKDILSMLRFARDSADQISYDRIQKTLGKNRLIHFNEHLKSLDISQLSSLELLESLVRNSGYLDKFNPKDEEDLRRLENIKELKSVAASYPKIDDFLENIALVQQEYSEQEKSKHKESKEGVRLMTLHSSKGLEFDIVFLVGLEEGILPHSRCLLDPTQTEEERRLCYVGITRAKDFLFLTYTTQRLYFGKSSLNEPSRFLADIPKNLLEFDSTEIIRDYRFSSRSPPRRGVGSHDSDLIYDPDIY